jgi:hypothetical protein
VMTVAQFRGYNYEVIVHRLLQFSQRFSNGFCTFKHAACHKGFIFVSVSAVEKQIGLIHKYLAKIEH